MQSPLSPDWTGWQIGREERHRSSPTPSCVSVEANAPGPGAPTSHPQEGLRKQPGTARGARQETPRQGKGGKGNGPLLVREIKKEGDVEGGQSETAPLLSKVFVLFDQKSDHVSRIFKPKCCLQKMKGGPLFSYQPSFAPAPKKIAFT